MHIPWAIILIITLTRGFTSSESNITIGAMVDLQYGFESMPEVVDKVTSAFSQCIPQHGHLEVKWALLKSTNITDITRTVGGMIHQGVQAVIAVLGFTQRKKVSGITETFRTPHLAVDLDLSSPAEYIYTLHLTSQYKTMSRVLIDIAKAADWGQIQLDFNKIVDYRTRQQFVLRLSLAGIQTILRPSTDTNLTDGGILLMIEGGTVNSKQNEDSSFWLAKAVFVHDLTKETVRRLQKTYKHTSVVAVEIISPSRCTRCIIESYENITACDAWECNSCFRLNKPAEYNLYFIPSMSYRDIIPLGQWTEDTGLSITTKYPDITNRLFARKLNDFGGITLRVVVHGKDNPFSSRDDSVKWGYSGMMIDIMDDLADKLNFRYTVTEAPDGQFGTKNSDGNFTGMVGMVARGEADIGAGTFTVNTERSEVVDFTTGFMQDSLGILTPKVTKTRNLFQVFKPFTLETWLTLLAVCLCACVVFVFISLKSPERTTDSASQQAILERNVLLIISTYFEQGPTFHPTSGSARCFLAFWMVFSLLTMMMFTANLAAVLTVTTPVKPIDTLQDLVEHTDLQSKQPIYKAIAPRMQTTAISRKGVEMVIDRKSCFITDRRYLEFAAAESCGELRLAHGRFYGFSLSFIITKNSPYKAAIDLSFQKMIESGLTARLLQKWMIPRTDCPTTDPIKIPQLGLDALGGVFIIYLAAIFASIIILFIQLLYSHYCR